MCFNASADKSLHVDESEPLVGYRYLTVNNFGSDNPRLSSVVQSTMWSADVMTASCPDRWAEDSHDAPNQFCACGLHAYASLEMAQTLGASYANTVNFLFRVKLWGDVCQHKNEGWRAQYMQIDGIVEPVEEPYSPSVFHAGDPDAAANCSYCKEMAKSSHERYEQRRELAKQIASKLNLSTIEAAPASS